MPASSSKSQIRVAFSVALVVVGSIAIFVGWSIPSRFKSMPLSVLAEAGARSETLVSVAIFRRAGNPTYSTWLARASIPLSVRRSIFQSSSILAPRES